MTNASAPASAALSRSRRWAEWLRLSTIMPSLILVVGLLVTYQLWQNEQRNALQMLRTQFDFRVSDISDDIIKRMGTYEQVMRGVDGLFSHASIVDRSEFHNYVARLQIRENYPGIQGIRFSPIVPLAEKGRHIAAMHKQGLAGYDIKPGGRRDFYTPVIYIEPPDERNEIIFGYDTYSDLEYPQPGDAGAGLRRTAMERARDTGQAAISGKIMLLFEKNKDAQYGFLMFLPVYKHDAPHDTLAERRANIIGWISSVFRAGDLMGGILGSHADEVDIDLYDGEAVSENSMLHDPDNSGANQDIDTRTRFSRLRPLEIAGHKWTLQVSSRPAFDAMINREEQKLILISGIGTSVLLTLLVWVLLRGRERALQYAAVMERESGINETLLRTASDGIHILDLEGNVVQANDAFCRMLGYTPDVMLTMNVAQWDAQFSPEELKTRIASLMGGSMVFETKHRHRDSHLLDVEINAVGMTIEGQPLLYCSARDVTERRQAEKVLKESREKLHTIIDTALDAVVIMDADGIIRGWNTQAENIFGWSRAEATGRLLHDTIIPPRYREAHIQGMNRFLTTGKASIINSRIEISALHRDGHEFPVELAIATVKTGDTYEFSSFIRDITERKQVAAQLEQFLKFFTLALDPLCIASPDGHFKRVNPAFAQLLGYTEEELLSKPFAEFIYPEDRQPTLDEVEKQLRGGVTLNFANRYLCKDGTLRWLSWKASQNKEDGFIYAAARDITERRQSEEALRKSESLLKQTQEITKVGGWDYDAVSRKISWTDEVYRIYEVDPDSFDPNNLDQNMKFYSPSDQAIVERAFKRAVELGEPYDLELRFAGARGTHKWIRTTAQVARVSGNVSRVFGNIMDITDKKLAEEKIWQQANFDALTNLPNRRMFRDRLEQEIKKSLRTSLPLALLFIDLDRFKEINDTLGHDMGDTLLVEAALRISECVRATDMVARLGGDEFTVILPDVDDISIIERISACILSKLSEPFHLNNEMAYVSASIGITLYPNDATEIEGLLKNADQAMYVAKEKGRNRHSYFTHSMQEAAQKRLRLINDLRNALSASQLKVYFQPIVDLGTGRINKAEALIRWQHPERGLVSPAEFIPLAEETGLIFEIGDWVFHESVRWVKRWRELYNNKLQVSVNKSPVQFYKDGIDHSAWLTYLQLQGMPGQCLAVEITEGLLMSSDSPVTGALLTLRDAGIQVSIDDFGTGYSSLSYLKKFDIDYLKIDQSFTRNLAPGSSDMALSEAIIMMAHRLGMKVVAEGVETEEQRDLLTVAGCDYAQGYLYSRPTPAEDFEVLLKENAAKIQ